MLTDFAGQVDDHAYGIAVQADGKIVLTGQAQNSTGGLDVGLVRYTSKGALDTTFGAAHTGKILTDFMKQSDEGFAVTAIGGGKLLVGATVTWSDSAGAVADSDFAVYRFNSNGTLDTTFAKTSDAGPGLVTADFSPTADAVDDYLSDMSVGCGGEIVVAGTTTVSVSSQGVGTYDFAVAKFKPDGTPDLTFNKTGQATLNIGSTNDIGRSVQLLNNDKVLVTGTTYLGTGASAHNAFAPAL